MRVYLSFKYLHKYISEYRRRPKDYQNIIFDRFAQVETQVSSKHCSSGIGLTLVKNLVELHKGKITLKSEVGKGSEFIITLPVKQEKSEE